MAGGDLQKRKEDKPPIKQIRIPRRTKERASDEKHYATQAREFFNEAVNNGTNHCIFCGKKVTTFQGLHHWRGRTGKYLLDNRYWSIVHNNCHLMYHNQTTKKMADQPWHNGFIERLSKFDKDSYRKYMNKIDKSRPLNPRMFDDEDL